MPAGRTFSLHPYQRAHHRGEIPGGCSHVLWPLTFVLIATVCFALLWGLWLWLLRRWGTNAGLVEALSLVGPWLPWLGLTVSAVVALLLAFLVLGAPVLPPPP